MWDDGAVRLVKILAAGMNRMQQSDLLSDAQNGPRMVPADVVEGLVALLGNSDALNVGYDAAMVLGRLGIPAILHDVPEVLSRVLAFLDSEDYLVRFNSLCVLTGMGAALGGRPDLVKKLVAMSKDASSTVRTASAGVLRGLSEAGFAEAETALANLLHDGDKGVRRAAATELGYLGSTIARRPEIGLRLLDLLRDPSVCYYATSAFGRIGWAGASSQVITRLRELSRDSNQRTRSAAITTLSTMSRGDIRFFDDGTGLWTLQTVAELST
jgi:HEAT repeat protein